MLILRTFSSFIHDRAKAAHRLFSSIGVAIYGALPFLFEGASGASAPGTTVLAVRGHDHAYQGGAPIPRGTIFSADRGLGADAGAITYLYKEPLVAGDIGNDVSIQRSASYAHPEGIFSAYVSPFIDSGFTNISSNDCALEAYLCLMVVNSVTITVQVHNVDLDEYSTAQAIASVNQPVWVRVQDIPCIGDKQNHFDLYLNTDGATDVYLFAAVIAETEAASQPDSDGTTNAWSTTYP